MRIGLDAFNWGRSLAAFRFEPNIKEDRRRLSKCSFPVLRCAIPGGRAIRKLFDGISWCLGDDHFGNQVQMVVRSHVTSIQIAKDSLNLG